MGPILVTPPVKPFLLRSFSLRKANIQTYHIERPFGLNVDFSLSMVMDEARCYVQHNIHSAACSYNSVPLITSLQGTGDLFSKDGSAMEGTLYNRLKSPLFKDNEAIMYGNFGGEPIVSFYTPDRSWDITCMAKDEGYTLAGTCRLDEILHSFLPSLKTTADVAFDAYYKNGQWEAEMLLHRLSAYGISWYPCQASLYHQLDHSSLQFSMGENETMVTGEGEINEQHHAFFTVKQLQDIHVREYAHLKDFYAYSEYKEGEFSLDLKGFVELYNRFNRFPFSANLFHKNGNAKAHIDVSSYTCRINKDDDEYKADLTIDAQSVMKAHLKGNQLKMQGMFDAFHDALKYGEIPVTGTANWSLKGELPSKHSPGLFIFDLEQGHLRLYETYNILKSLHGFAKVTMDGIIEIPSLQAQFHSGNLEIQNARLQIGSHGLSGYSLPLTIRKIFLNYHKELFVQVSGYALIEGTATTGLVKSFILIDKSLITGNIFSPEFYASSAVSKPTYDTSPTLLLDCMVMTRTPLTIKSPICGISSDIQITLGGTVSQPTLEGSIDLAQGILQLPYDVLYITHGSLRFKPHAMNEPYVEFIAKNTIKNHDITLAVHGTLTRPEIHFDSSPALTKEQIITLLLGGSEDGSLSIMMPHTMTELFEQLLFGSTANISRAQKYINSLFEPLKSVRFVPRFSDQTGRGGLRGALEIEVNERLKATIQQNFTLTEDTRVDVSYALSDDAAIKLLKDERGDFGGMLENRWRW